MSKFQVTKKDLERYQTFNDEDYYRTDDEDEDGFTRYTTRRWRDTGPQSDDEKQRHSKRKHIGKLRRIEQLAQPKIRANPPELYEPFRVRTSALNYNATDRLSDLAMPKRLHCKTLTKDTSFCSTDIKDSVKKPSHYVISERLRYLSQPKRSTWSSHRDLADGSVARFNYPVDNTQMNRLTRLVELTRLPRHKLMQIPEKKPGAVSYSALVCRASPRIEELAGPKIRRTPKLNEFAFAIKPAALKYTPTNRINTLAMARPKVNNSEDRHSTE